MKTLRRPARVLFASAAVSLIVNAPSAAVVPGEDTPKCHGKRATFIGTPGNDRIDGENVRPGETLILLGGNDSLSGLFANDVTVCGGPGKDLLSAQGFNTRTLIDGGSGRDEIGDFADPKFVDSGRLRLIGGPGADVLSAGGKNSELYGREGDDSLSGRSGDDRLRGDEGDDEIEGWLGQDNLYGGDGDDTLDGDPPARYGKGERDYAFGNHGIDRCAAEFQSNCELGL